MASCASSSGRASALDPPHLPPPSSSSASLAHLLGLPEAPLISARPAPQPKALSHRTLHEISIVWGAGDEDGRAVGMGRDVDLSRPGLTHVRWKQFALDFDDTPPVEPEPTRPMPPWMAEELRALRRVATSRRLKLRDGFEEMMSAGTEKNMGVMDRTQFVGTLGIFFAQGKEPLKQAPPSADLRRSPPASADAGPGGASAAPRLDLSSPPLPPAFSVSSTRSAPPTAPATTTPAMAAGA